MSVRTVVVVLLALVCGVSSAVGVAQFRTASSATAPNDTIPVVVAKVIIPRGTTVSEDMIEIRRWPKDVVPDGTLSRTEDVVDRAAAMPLLVGEPLIDLKLASKDAGRGLAALIPKGMRAYTIQTKRAAANVAGFVLPGNRVDVLLTLKSNRYDESGGGSTTTLLQKAEILAVDQQLDAPAENKVDPKETGSVTLLITPQQAAVLDLGQSLGQLSLSLRNPEDLDLTEIAQATLADIKIPGVHPAPEPSEVPRASQQTDGAQVNRRVFEIRTLRGSHSGQVLVEQIE